jgi:hypothetical protein
MKSMQYFPELDIIKTLGFPIKIPEYYIKNNAKMSYVTSLGESMCRRPINLFNDVKLMLCSAVAIW